MPSINKALRRDRKHNKKSLKIKSISPRSEKRKKKRDQEWARIRKEKEKLLTAGYEDN